MFLSKYVSKIYNTRPIIVLNSAVGALRPASRDEYFLFNISN